MCDMVRTNQISAAPLLDPRAEVRRVLNVSPCTAQESGNQTRLENSKPTEIVHDVECIVYIYIYISECSRMM